MVRDKLKKDPSTLVDGSDLIYVSALVLMERLQPQFHPLSVWLLRPVDCLSDIGRVGSITETALCHLHGSLFLKHDMTHHGAG